MKKLLTTLFFTLSLPVYAQIGSVTPSYNERLSDYAYPFPVNELSFESQQTDLTMAYMALQPQKPNGHTVLLLHGKNFNGAYWEQSARDLVASGFKVLIPDQIGFGKSSKPEKFQYSFHEMATHTRKLLQLEDVSKVIVTGHSMGGMLAVRFALMYPEMTEKLVLINPIGLEDWQAKGVPYQQVGEAFEQEMQKTPEQLRRYQEQSYYDGQWKPEYERWLAPLIGWQKGPDRQRIAWNAALTSDMVFTQPIVYSLPQLKMPTLLIIGQRDRTAIGADRAPEQLRKQLGNYPELGKAAVKAIPGAKIVELPGVGHLPQIEAYASFWPVYKDFLTAK